MTQIIHALADVAAPYDAVFCDLWGCLHNGEAPFAAAVEALQAYRAAGGVVVLLTNSPRPASSVLGQLQRIGVPDDCHDLIVSSGDAAQYALLTGAVGRRVHHIGAEKDMVFFTDFAGDLAPMAAGAGIVLVPLTEAEGIVCTGLRDDQTETPADYRAALLLGKTRDLPMLCANPDLVVDLGHKRIYCAGAIAQAYEEMGGQTLYFGKPHPPIYDLARRRLAAHVGRDDLTVLCIGDGPGTDVQGGQSEGLDTLFITGGLAADQFGPDVANPDAGMLEEWLEGKMLSPAYAMGFLR